MDGQCTGFQGKKAKTVKDGIDFLSALATTTTAILHQNDRPRGCASGLDTGQSA